MRLVRCGLVGLGLGLASLAPAAVANASAADLTLVKTERKSPRLSELTFTTPAVKGETHVRVLLPAGYDADTAKRYPVLFLLHGGADNYASWTDKGDAEAITASSPLIVVMPDSGPGGGYADWYDNGNGGPPKWETYHLTQLLPWVDSHYRTTRTREGRAVAGLSMGGGGSMGYAARHPDLFVSATSWSGALDTNRPLVWPLTESAGSVFGPRATQEVRWRAYNAWDLAENLGGLDLTARTGNGLPGGPGGDTGDPIEAEVHEMGINFHEKLTRLGIPHVWDDYGAGGHAWFYWQRGLKQLMPALAKVFADPPAAPTPFTHRRVEPEYSVWGWTVKIDRPALEWSALTNASRRGFALSGSGTGTVTTAPLYKPGAKLKVTITKGDGTTRKSVKVRKDCRLKLTVPLGPGNPNQQYTLQSRASGGNKSYTTRVRIANARRCSKN